MKLTHIRHTIWTDETDSFSTPDEEVLGIVYTREENLETRMVFWMRGCKVVKDRELLQKLENFYIDSWSHP